jgi:hypothetical protein
LQPALLVRKTAMAETGDKAFISRKSGTQSRSQTGAPLQERGRPGRSKSRMFKHDGNHSRAVLFMLLRPGRPHSVVSPAPNMVAGQGWTPNRRLQH